MQPLLQHVPLLEDEELPEDEEELLDEEVFLQHGNGSQTKSGDGLSQPHPPQNCPTPQHWIPQGVQPEELLEEPPEILSVVVLIGLHKPVFGSQY